MDHVESLDMLFSDAYLNFLLAEDVPFVCVESYLIWSPKCNYGQFFFQVPVSMEMDLSFIDIKMAKAWNLHHNKPLRILLDFSLAAYLGGAKPKMAIQQVTQSSFKLNHYQVDLEQNQHL